MSHAEIQRLGCGCPQKQCGQVRPLSIPVDRVTGLVLEDQLTSFYPVVQIIPSSWPNLPEAQERECPQEHFKLTNPRKTTLKVFVSSWYLFHPPPLPPSIILASVTWKKGHSFHENPAWNFQAYSWFNPNCLNVHKPLQSIREALVPQCLPFEKWEWVTTRSEGLHTAETCCVEKIFNLHSYLMAPFLSVVVLYTDINK